MTVEEYLGKMIGHLGVDDGVEFNLKEDDNRLHVAVTVPEESVALLIGNRGETLDAIELLTKLTFKDQYQSKKIVVDINNYRQKNLDKLRQKALDVAYRVLETQQPFEFRNLNSFERYQLHTVLTENEELQDLTSFSEDRPDGRVLIIAPKNMVTEDNEESENTKADEDKEE